MEPKHRIFNIGILIALILFFVASSCSQPVSSETFIPSSKVDSLGYYTFEVDFSDSTKVYDVYFYTRLDMPFTRNIPALDLPLEAIWKSPSGKNYRDLLVLSKEDTKQYFTKDYYSLYRKKISPNENGIWQLSTKIVSDVALIGEATLYGFGIRVIHHSVEN